MTATTLVSTSGACVSCRAPLTSGARNYCPVCRPPLLAIVPAPDEMHDTTHCAKAAVCRCTHPTIYSDQDDDLRCFTCGRAARGVA